MLSNSRAKYIRSLQQRKYRQKYDKIVVEGVKIVDDIRNDGLVNICELYATTTYLNERVNVDFGTDNLHETDPAGLKKISSFRTPNQVLAVVDKPALTADIAVCTERLVLYLDGIRDPGNLGTIIRTADWFGIRNVFLSGDCADPFNPKVIQSSMASIFRVQLGEAQSADLSTSVGTRIMAATIDGTPLAPGKIDAGLLILGNESRGVSEKWLARSTERVAIDGSRTLGAESLNVASACAVLLAYIT